MSLPKLEVVSAPYAAIQAAGGKSGSSRFLWQKMTPILGSLKLMSFKL